MPSVYCLDQARCLTETEQNKCILRLLLCVFKCRNIEQKQKISISSLVTDSNNQKSNNDSRQI